MGKTFLDESHEREWVGDIMSETDKNVGYFTQISDSLVEAYTQDLDNLMRCIKADTVDQEPSDAILEKYVLELSNMLYFIGQRLENVGVKEDLSKLAAKEVYNNSYMDNLSRDGKKPTVAELTTMAENDSKYETVINSIYSRAYRQIKYKSDAAYEMLSSLRKIISKRMQEYQLSFSRQNGGIVTGREEF